VVPVEPDDLLVGATYMAQYGLDFNDAVNLAMMERCRVTKIYTNDKRHFGGLEHVEAVWE